MDAARTLAGRILAISQNTKHQNRPNHHRQAPTNDVVSEVLWPAPRVGATCALAYSPAHGHEEWFLMSGDASINRRAFLRLGLGKTGKLVEEVVAEKLQQTIQRPALRPPGAVAEVEFLASCTRCNDCKEACPHDAIQQVDPIGGGIFGNTPFIEPTLGACQFCDDLPCIKACETGALLPPAEPNTKRIGWLRIDAQHCLIRQGQHCDYYCLKNCPTTEQALSKGADGEPEVDTELCVGCGKCVYICVSQTGPALVVEPV